MAFDNSYTAVTGATYAASDYNTYTKGNFTAIWVGTTAGDLDYYTSATAKSRLALVTGGLLYGGASAPAWLAAGTQYQVLRMGASYPEWAAQIFRRQGGDASNWQSAGTTTYTPTVSKRQKGVKSVSINPSGTVSVTYPVAFTNRPIILVTINAGSGNITCRITNDSVSGFDAVLYDTSTSGSISVSVNWEAEGD